MKIIKFRLENERRREKEEEEKKRKSMEEKVGWSSRALPNILINLEKHGVFDMKKAESPISFHSCLEIQKYPPSNSNTRLSINHHYFLLQNITITYERTIERTRTEEVDERVIDMRPDHYLTRFEPPESIESLAIGRHCIPIRYNKCFSSFDICCASHSQR